MKWKSVVFITLTVFTLVIITGCGFVADGPFGWVYTNNTVPITVGTSKTGSKSGKSCVYSFFGGLSIGNASIDKAMEDGEITEIYTVNKENYSIIGTYTKQCTVVKGE